MAILPAVGAVAGVVGTIGQMGAANKSAASQRAQLDAQNQQLTEQHKLLLIQRENQATVAGAEASRARAMESLASAANLFNVSLQEQSITSQRIAEELDTRAAEFQVEQQSIGQLTEAYGAEAQTFAGLFDQMKQQQAGQVEMSSAMGEVTAGAASRGQESTASTDALTERIALDSQAAFQQANQLFEMLSAQSAQNIETTEAMTGLQRQLGLSDIEMARQMGDFNRSAGLMQLNATRDATLLEEQMNQAAIDEQLAAQRGAIAAATSADSINIQGAQSVNRIQRQGASGPSFFEMLPGLTQAGLGAYSAFSPPSALPARNLNPLFNAGAGGATSPASGLRNVGFSGSSLSNLPSFNAGGYGQSFSGFAPSLFNIG